MNYSRRTVLIVSGAVGAGIALPLQFLMGRTQSYAEFDFTGNWPEAFKFQRSAQRATQSRDGSWELSAENTPRLSYGKFGEVNGTLFEGAHIFKSALSLNPDTFDHELFPSLSENVETRITEDIAGSGIDLIGWQNIIEKAHRLDLSQSQTAGFAQILNTVGSEAPHSLQAVMRVFGPPGRSGVLLSSLSAGFVSQADQWEVITQSDLKFRGKNRVVQFKLGGETITDVAYAQLCESPDMPSPCFFPIARGGTHQEAADIAQYELSRCGISERNPIVMRITFLPHLRPATQSAPVVSFAGDNGNRIVLDRTSEKEVVLRFNEFETSPLLMRPKENNVCCIYLDESSARFSINGMLSDTISVQLTGRQVIDLNTDGHNFGNMILHRLELASGLIADDSLRLASCLNPMVKSA